MGVMGAEWVASPWSARVALVMRALGWPLELMARELGFAKPNQVKRLLRGGRPSVDVLLRLQTIERRYAGEIEEQKRNPRRNKRKAFLWPPVWVECNKRRWIGGPESSPPARPADLQTLGGDRTDPARVLTGWLDPRNFPGRTLRTVDFTPEGRRRYAEDRAELARRSEVERRELQRTARAVKNGEKC